MGKKRRYLHRSRKFAKKAFKFLDKADGSAADGAIEAYDPFVDTIVVTDNEDQTITITGRVLGNVEGLDADPNERKVQFSRDGGATFDAGTIITDDSGVDPDRFLYTVSNIGRHPQAAFAAGSNSIIVRVVGVTDTQRDKEASFSVRENKITVDTTKFTDNGAGNILLATAEIFSAGKIKAGSATAVSEDTNGFKIEAALVEESGLTTLTVHADVDDEVQADLGALGGSVAVLDAAIANTGGTVRLTVTPKDSDDNLLTESATTFDVPVASF